MCCGTKGPVASLFEGVADEVLGREYDIAGSPDCTLLRWEYEAAAGTVPAEHCFDTEFIKTRFDGEMRAALEPLVSECRQPPPENVRLIQDT